MRSSHRLGFITPVLLLLLPMLAAAEPPRAAPITVATYNIHNFFDNFDNPYTADEGTRQKSRHDLDHLTDAIKIINADVLVLQEVETGGFLQQFVRQRLAGLGYAVVDEPSFDPRGIGIAILSRLPVLRIVSHRLTLLDPAAPEVEENHFARDLLRIDVRTAGGSILSIYGTHFKSKLDSPGDPQSAHRRLAEATRAAALISEEMAVKRAAATGGEFILLGDFNDTPDSPPMRKLHAGLPPSVDALQAIPPPQRITFESAQFHESIDDILISRGVKITTPAEILRAGVFQKASDHRPVRVTIELPPPAERP